MVYKNQIKDAVQCIDKSFFEVSNFICNIDEMGESLNDMHLLKVKACTLDTGQEKDIKINLINNAIEIL